MSEEEYWSDSRENSPNLVTAPPKSFGEWMDKDTNLERIGKASERGTLPYWLRDNEKIKDCSLLMSKARNVGNTVKEQAEAIAKKYGGVATPINYKGFSSLYRKLNTEEGILISDIKDSVRNTIIVDKENIEYVVKDLQGLSSFSRYKQQTPENFCGYSGNIINLKMPNGIQAEIQVNTPKMIYAKESETNARRILGDKVWEQISKETGLPGGLGQKYYDEIRILDKITDKNKIEELTKLSKDYYSHFGYISEKNNILPQDVVEYVPKYFSEVQKEIDDNIVAFCTKGNIKGIEDFFKHSGLSIQEAQNKLNRAISDADIYMSIDNKTLINKIVKGDGYFKSSIETGKGTFKTIGEDRAIKERRMFGIADDCSLDEYPKYGFLSKKGKMSYERIADWGYGDTFVRFKSSVKRRSTFTIGDSYDGNRFIPKEKIKSFKEDLKFQFDNGFTEHERKEAFLSLKNIEKIENKKTIWTKIAPASEVNNPNIKSLLSLKYGNDPIKMGPIIDKGIDEIGNVTGTYIESQIYGKLSIKDVASIEVSSIKQKTQLEKLLKKIGSDAEVVPCKYNPKLKKLENAFIDYDDKPSQFIYSLTNEDIDNLGDFYINGILKRFGDSKNPYWKEIRMSDKFVSLQVKVFNEEATIIEKRNYCKLYLEEIRKKEHGAFPKVWWENYRSTQGGWTSDVLQKDLLSRKE